MTLDIKAYNDRWLQAWSEKDVPALLRFYAEDVFYRDPMTTVGIRGRQALKRHLDTLFGSTPRMLYEADEIWATANGYCGRWYCTILPKDGPPKYLRGFDLVVLQGEEIIFNEVYVHHLEGSPAPEAALTDERRQSAGAEKR